MGGWKKKSRCALPRRGRNVLCREAVDDAPLLQVVGGHLHSHPISGKNPDAVYAHASRKVAEEFVIFDLVAGNANPEHGVRKRFLHDADEFDYVLLGHRTKEDARTRAEASYRAILAPASIWLQFS